MSKLCKSFNFVTPFWNVLKIILAWNIATVWSKFTQLILCMLANIKKTRTEKNVY